MFSQSVAADGEAEAGMNSLTIEGDSHESPDGRLTDIELHVDGTWSFEGVEYHASTVTLTLAVWAGDVAGWEVVDQPIDVAVDGFEGSGAYSMGGSIIQGTAFSVDHFAADEDGSTNTTEVTARVYMGVKSAKRKKTMVSDEARDDFTITIKNTPKAAKIEGEGKAKIIDDEDRKCREPSPKKCHDTCQDTCQDSGCDDSEPDDCSS